MRLPQRLARTLRSWADRIDPPANSAKQARAAASSVGPEMAKANRMVFEIHLRRALRRYSPAEQPAQA